MGLEILIRPQLEVGLVFTHDLVGHGSAAVFIFQLHRGARTPRGHRHPGLDGSMICAADSLPSTSMMRPSMKPWRSLADSYSAFSLKSPWARASAIACDHGGTLHGLRAVQFFFELFCATLGNWAGLPYRVSPQTAGLHAQQKHRPPRRAARLQRGAFYPKANRRALPRARSRFRAIMPYYGTLPSNPTNQPDQRFRRSRACSSCTEVTSSAPARMAFMPSTAASAPKMVVKVVTRASQRAGADRPRVGDGVAALFHGVDDHERFRRS